MSTIKKEKEKLTLFIEIWNSTCGNCGKGCDPDSKTHDKILDFHDNGKPGCGVEWKYVSSKFYGNQFESRLREMRPDLEFYSKFICPQ